MPYFKWVLLIILAAAFGYLVVVYMTVHPLQMSLYLLLSIVAGFALVLLLFISFRQKWMLPLALVLSLTVFLASYHLKTKAFLAREDSRPVPVLTRAKGDPGDGHTAVIYFTHGEPETYDPIGWINQFNEFDEQGIAFIPMIARPFFVYQLRTAYLKLVQAIIDRFTIKCCRVWREPTGTKGMIQPAFISVS